MTTSVLIVEDEPSNFLYLPDFRNGSPQGSERRRSKEKS